MKTSTSRKIEEMASHRGPTKHCKGLNGMVAVPFEDLLKALPEPQLHIEGQLNHIAGAKNRFSKLSSQILLKSRAVKHPYW